MATDQQKLNKRQQIEDERKKSYIFAGKNFLNANQGGANSAIKNNLSSQDVVMTTNSNISRGGVSSNQNNISNLYQQSKQNQLFEKRSDPNFPTALEIEHFQSQLTIKFNTFKTILEEEFKQNKPADSLVLYMFERFRRFKFNDQGTEVDKKQDMDILDFLLAMNLLARIVYDKKLRMMFELCDDDDDGCMRPAEILQMLQKVERIFARECSRVDLQSQILINSIADKKAEQNFHFIMGMIKHQNIKKLQDQAKKEQGSKEGKNDNSNKHVTTNSDGIKVITYEVEEDNLITYREFISAIKGLKNSLYKSILPRTLSFVDVLSIMRKEDDFKISDVQVDDFVMFRYELNSIFRKHQFVDENNSERFGGKFPLSKINGLQIKDLPQDAKKELLDLYRPPGIVERLETNIGAKTQLDEKIWMTMPTAKLYRRDKQDEKREEKLEKYGVTSTFAVEQRKEREREMNPNFKKLEDKLYIHMRQENPNQLNFEEMFQENLPPEAKELEDYAKKLKDKGESKDKEIEKYQRNAQDKLRRVKNLVPENKTNISSLRMQEEQHDHDRRHNMMKAMNAPQISQQKLKEDLLLEQLKEQFS